MARGGASTALLFLVLVAMTLAVAETTTEPITSSCPTPYACRLATGGTRPPRRGFNWDTTMGRCCDRLKGMEERCRCATVGEPGVARILKDPGWYQLPSSCQWIVEEKVLDNCEATGSELLTTMPLRDRLDNRKDGAAESRQATLCGNDHACFLIWLSLYALVVVCCLFLFVSAVSSVTGVCIIYACIANRNTFFR
ncbi:hypothetical protein ACP70R_004864 [Stipagrostis hirtigluma subsp. patula]